MPNRFSAAPWSGLLKGMSIIASLLLVGAGYTMLRTTPALGSLKLLSIMTACGLPAMALIALLFVVISYEVDGNQLRIRRLLWHTRVDLAGLQEVRVDPGASRGSIRTAGNGGLFSFTGYYRNPSLGSYEAYVTDWKLAVVMRLPRRVVVISPADPAAFVRTVQGLLPHSAGDSR